MNELKGMLRVLREFISVLNVMLNDLLNEITTVVDEEIKFFIDFELSFPTYSLSLILSFFYSSLLRSFHSQLSTRQLSSVCPRNRAATLILLYTILPF